MTESDFERHQKAAATREYRLRIGRDPDAVKWQEALEKMLIRLGPRLVPGRLVGFADLETDEERLFKALNKEVIVPDAVNAIYIPASAMRAMMAEGAEESPVGSPADGVGEDLGILIAARSDDDSSILYVQFGLPPGAVPGSEVYRDGEVLAVYQYASVQQCVSEINALVETYLARPAAGQGAFPS